MTACAMLRLPTRVAAWSRLLGVFLALVMVAFPATVMADDLTYLVHQPARMPGSGHPPLIVLLHGSGADEHDMIGLWRDLPAGLVVISPRAPFHHANGGWRWYRKETRDADLATSKAIIDRILANAVQRFDADPKRLFIAGFSQGAVMTYEVALREPGTFRGAAVLSGILFPSVTKAIPAGADETPFFVAHGEADPVIPFTAATSARAVLAKLGVPTAFHAYPGMTHTVGPQETQDLSAWLAQRLASEGAVR